MTAYCPRLRHRTGTAVKRAGQIPNEVSKSPDDDGSTGCERSVEVTEVYAVKREAANKVCFAIILDAICVADRACLFPMENNRSVIAIIDSANVRDRVGLVARRHRGCLVKCRLLRRRRGIGKRRRGATAGTSGEQHCGRNEA